MKKEYIAPTAEVVGVLPETCFAGSTTNSSNTNYDYEHFDFE